tara:strand:+ start:314 stop:658 length:345 start_codon:yes stop_codon:yes gene_type:complete
MGSETVAVLESRSLLSAGLIAREVAHLGAKTQKRGRATAKITAADLRLSLDDFDAILAPLIDELSGDPFRGLPVSFASAARVTLENMDSYAVIDFVGDAMMLSISLETLENANG